METWKDVNGYKGRYQVSNMGRVKSLSRKVKGVHGCERQLPERIMKLHSVKDGYKMVELMTNGRKTRKSFQVHRLVLSAFYGDSNLECNHKNKIRYDNRLENLEYCSRVDNVPRGDDHWSRINPEKVCRGDKHYRRIRNAVANITIY